MSNPPKWADDRLRQAYELIDKVIDAEQSDSDFRMELVRIADAIENADCELEKAEGGMSDEITWGPEIPVDGKQPEWLGDEQICRPRWGDDTWYGEKGAPAHCVYGWDTVTAIKLPADHPIYGRLSVADDVGEPVAERPTKTLRDEFAASIAAALCSAHDNTGMWTGLVDDEAGYRIVAERSYRMADAMLAARGRGQ